MSSHISRGDGKSVSLTTESQIPAANLLNPEGMDSGDLARMLDERANLEIPAIQRAGFPALVRVLDGIAKVNPHQHITGSVGNPNLLKRALYIYRNDPSAGEAFLNFLVENEMIRPQDSESFLQHSDEDLIQWLLRNIPFQHAPIHFEHGDDRLSIVRTAFQSNHPESIKLLKDAYRVAALENISHGVSELWFRTSLGDHDNETFVEAAQAAIEGAKQAELEADSAIKVRFIVGMRKYHYESSADNPVPIDAKSVDLVTKVVSLRRKFPDMADKIIGTDSVGCDSEWNPDWQAPARIISASCGLHNAVHFGESWSEGGLLPTLVHVKTLVNGGDIRQLDNTNALFATKDSENQTQRYSDSDWNEISLLQIEIFGLLIKNGICLCINPSSNDWLTRTLRKREGWRIRRHDEPVHEGALSVSDLIMADKSKAEHLVLLVGNDNSRIYPTRIPGAFLTVSEELANMWKAPGSSHKSVYGKLPSESIAQLILNGLEAASLVRRNQGIANVENSLLTSDASATAQGLNGSGYSRGKHIK